MTTHRQLITASEAAEVWHWVQAQDPKPEGGVYAEAYRRYGAGRSTVDKRVKEARELGLIATPAHGQGDPGKRPRPPLEEFAKVYDLAVRTIPYKGTGGINGYLTKHYGVAPSTIWTWAREAKKRGLLDQDGRILGSTPDDRPERPRAPKQQDPKVRRARQQGLPDNWFHVKPEAPKKRKDNGSAISDAPMRRTVAPLHPNLLRRARRVAEQVIVNKKIGRGQADVIIETLGLTESDLDQAENYAREKAARR